MEYREVIFHNSGSGFNPIISDHDGQKATVIRQLEWDTEVDREVGPMYRIRFTDGVEISAFEDELENILDAMNEEDKFLEALAESTRIDNAYRDGWEAARKYYMENVREGLIEWVTDEDLHVIMEDLFDYPEDESEILRKAALNRGQP